MKTPRLTTLFAAAVGLLSACVEPPTAVRTSGLDASLVVSAGAYVRGEQQPDALPLLGSWAIYPEGVGQNLSQTFTPTEGQWLGYLQVPVGCVPGVLLNVKIRDGLGGAILFESDHSGLPTVVDGSFTLLQVFNPAITPRGIKLNNGRTYAFELAAIPGPGATGNSCGLARGPSRNGYDGGKGYYRDPINGTTAWLPIPNGAPSNDEDLPFITLVLR